MRPMLCSPITHTYMSAIQNISLSSFPRLDGSSRVSWLFHSSPQVCLSVAFVFVPVIVNTVNSGISTFKCPKISRLFDNNLSPGEGGAQSQKPISQKRHGRKFFKWRGWIPQVQISQNQSFI
jgi:hypothetical protein